MLAESQQALPIVREPSWQGVRGLLRTCWRYGLSTIGPVAVSAAHFIASLTFLRVLQQHEFGQFSFLLIVVPFCLSASGALLGAPASLTRRKDEATARAEILTLHKASLVLALLAGVAVAALMYSTQSGPRTALVFGLYGGLATLRSFSRSLANVHAKIARVACSDIVYGTLVVAGLLGLAFAGRLDMFEAAAVLAFAAAAGFLPFGWSYAADLVRGVSSRAFVHYLPMWREVTRWSLLGVVLTELTANAHAYLVTFISGPKAFGLLAIGALFMRPASLVLAALPDIDLPLITRRIAQGDGKGAWQVVKEFRTAASAVLAATVALSAALMIWVPHLLLKKGYDGTEVLIVLGFWIAITAVRVVRTPESVFIQATGDYPALARISAWSSVTALVTTFTLLCLAGPIVSLGGVLAGEIVIVLMVFRMTKAWRARHV